MFKWLFTRCEYRIELNNLNLGGIDYKSNTKDFGFFEDDYKKTYIKGNVTLEVNHNNLLLLGSFGYFENNTAIKYNSISNNDIISRINTVYHFKELKFLLGAGYTDTLNKIVIKTIAGLVYERSIEAYTETNILTYNSINNELIVRRRHFYEIPKVSRYGIFQQLVISKLFLNNKFSLGLVLRNKSLYNRFKSEYKRTDNWKLFNSNFDKNSTIKDEENNIYLINFTYGLQLVYNIYSKK